MIRIHSSSEKLHSYVVRLERIKGMIDAEERSKLNLHSYMKARLCNRHGGAW